MTVEEKKVALQLLSSDKQLLQEDIRDHAHTYSDIVQRILHQTLDRWQFEIDELQYDIEHQIGAIHKEKNE